VSAGLGARDRGRPGGAAAAKASEQDGGGAQSDKA